MIDRTTDLLGAALSGLNRRTEAIAGNIANIDTPGYTPVAVDFETALRAQLNGDEAPHAVLGMKRTDPRHLDARAAAGDAASSTVATGGRTDGNSVDAEAEMVALTQTQLKTSMVTRFLSGRFDMIRTAIGRR